MYLVFDIGGTSTRLAYSPDGQKLEDPVKIPTHPDFSQAMEEISALVPKITQGRPIKATAVGIAAPMDEEHSVLLNASNLPGWSNQPFQKELERITGNPVYLENDTTMVGIAEARQGAGKGHEIVAYITVSTGIGGRRFVNGQVEPSALGFEPGHMIIDIDGFVCNPGCGFKGHWEGLASGNGVRRRFGKEAQYITDPAVWADITHHLAAGLINVTVMWSPHCIVLGGPMMKDIPLKVLHKQMEQVGSYFRKLPELKLAEFGEIGGLVGALIFLAAPREAH